MSNPNEPNSALVSDLKELLVMWRSMESHLETEAAYDESCGLKRTAEVGYCSASAINGCIRSLSDTLERHIPGSFKT